MHTACYDGYYAIMIHKKPDNDYGVSTLNEFVVITWNYQMLVEHVTG